MSPNNLYLRLWLLAYLCDIQSETDVLPYCSCALTYITGMRLGFSKNSGKFYVAVDSYPNNTIRRFSYLR